VEDFGQLANYHTVVPGLCRGMLFNAKEFWLYESHNGNPLRLIKNELGAPGSLMLVRTFFHDPERPLPDPPLVVLLRALMLALGVAPCEISPGSGSFLGSGGSGRVFSVCRGDVFFALKASCVSSQGDLTFEFEQLLSAAARGAPVISVVKDSLRFPVGVDGCSIGGGYLMRETLEPFEITSQARCKAAFDSLFALHAKGIVHGDARLPNLLKTGPTSRPIWIDIRRVVYADLVGELPLPVRRDDAGTLATSILNGLGGILPPLVKEALALLTDDIVSYHTLSSCVFSALPTHTFTTHT